MNVLNIDNEVLLSGCKQKNVHLTPVFKVYKFGAKYVTSLET